MVEYNLKKYKYLYDKLNIVVIFMHFFPLEVYNKRNKRKYKHK